MEDGDETSGPDQMLDEACQLAAQLHELSNNDSINLEIGKIAESITVCTDLLNNLRATGLSHTLHLEQIAEDLNGVHEGHGISKALLSELQKDIAAMRSAIESIKIESGTVAPVASNSGRATTSVDTTAESMCPLLDNLEERTSILLSEMGADASTSLDHPLAVEESTDFRENFADLVLAKVSAVEAQNFSYEVTTDAGPTCSTSRWEEFLSESASRWLAQDSPASFAVSDPADAVPSPSPEHLATLMAPTRSEPSRVPCHGDDGAFQGEVELDVDLPGGGDTSFPSGSTGSGEVFHAHSDGHVLSSQSDLPSDGGHQSKPWRQRFRRAANAAAAERMRLRLFGPRAGEGAAGMMQHRNVDRGDHELT